MLTVSTILTTSLVPFCDPGNSIRVFVDSEDKIMSCVSSVQLLLRLFSLVFLFVLDFFMFEFELVRLGYSWR